jgi:phospholipid transport system substrate-binding protein
MRFLLKQCLLLLLAGSVIVAGSAIASTPSVGDPVALLQSLAQQMLTDLRQHKDIYATHPLYSYKLACRLVVPHVDVAEMERQVLPMHVWQNASAAQAQDFKSQFLQLIMHTYAAAISSYQSQVLKFYPVRGGYQDKQQVVVTSIITDKDGGAPIKVEYKLIRRGSSWYLYDMVVSGISVIASFREQFANLIATSNLDGLIQSLKWHNSQLAKA